MLFSVLKAMYFPHSSFLTANTPQNSSYTWRNIVGAKHVIEQGSRWKLGTGEKILIWKDRWLPCSTTYKVQNPPNSLPENATVNLLIDWNTCRWKHEIIDAVFTPNEAQIIKSIPLSHRNHKDILIWNGTTCGVFTVKNATQQGNAQIQITVNFCGRVYGRWNFHHGSKF